MKTKLIYGSLAAGAVLFFMGFVIFGLLLSAFMAENTNQCIVPPGTEMKWWSIVLSNLLTGFLLALILDWSSANTAAGGLKKGAAFGFLISTAFNLSLHSMTNYFLSTEGLLADVAGNTVLMAAAGLTIGFIYSRPAPRKPF